MTTPETKAHNKRVAQEWYNHMNERNYRLLFAVGLNQKGNLELVAPKELGQKEIILQLEHLLKHFKQ